MSKMVMFWLAILSIFRFTPHRAGLSGCFHLLRLIKNVSLKLPFCCSCYQMENGSSERWACVGEPWFVFAAFSLLPKRSILMKIEPTDPLSVGSFKASPFYQ